MEADIVSRAGIRFRAIPAAGLHGVGWRHLPGNLLRLLRGLLASFWILRQFRPDALLFTGGYVAAPMALAGRKLPTLLYVPDIQPGLALNFLARFADRIAVTAAASAKYFRQTMPIVVTGYPLRADLAAWSRTKAMQHLQLAPDLPTVLIVGGSQGARSINNAVLKHLSALLGMAQVVHISGLPDWQAVEAAARGLPGHLAQRYHPMAYLHEMGAALAAADLVVSRAGASSLGEYPFFGLPAVLVPYPHAWRYQKVNADYLAQVGAAVVLEDRWLNERLLILIRDLLDNPHKRQAMRTAMHSLSHPEAANAIAGLLIELAG
jgi:UDP-N-acetylglucosamine--N-acetylmuramyl-(pentapeptide) pyrophosphoryl-undecaprenol N-acetylglucosamine transferase